MSTALSLRSGLCAVTREIDPPLHLLEALGPDGFAWLHDGIELVTAGAVAQLDVGDAAAALTTIERDDEVDLPGTGPIAVGALPFHPAAPRRLTIPTTIVGRAPGGRSWITEIGPRPSTPHEIVTPPGRYTVAAVEDRAAWCRAVEHALHAIARDELDKVVLSRAVTVDADRPFDRRAVLARLRSQQPGCFVYAHGSLVGATPELLVRRTGARVEARPLAGTAPGNGASLGSSRKDVAEHRHVVDALVHDLAPFCDSLDVPSTPRVVRFTDVAHLATPIGGRLRVPLPSAAALAARLHPTPAVAGTPTPAALAVIERLERSPRGRYAGPVGWVDANGDGEWGVALRGAEIDGCRAVLRTGAGIVAGSDPDGEWAETEVKLDPMLRALVRV